MRKLLTLEPSFVDVFDPAIIIESGLNKQIEQLGESVSTQIARLNSAYSSETGRDLFKSTNKTTASLMNMRKSIVDYSDYKHFVEDLYFLFHESVGDRLSANTPTAFVDVNSLRTELQHDLDHGKTSRVAAKRKKIGETFEKYAGTSSPATLAPEKFPAVQTKLLQDIDETLANLMWK